ncbi:MAG: hypothetical protein Q4Q07_06095 [Tissierellia bacterium]|nr:hypothetical protein [Tissierellia bacterium]
MLDWKEYKIEEVTIDENNIILHLLGARLDFNEEDLQTMVTNGSLLLVLVEDANSIQYEYDEPAFAVDREMAGTMLKTNFNKTIEDFRKSKEDFKELQDGLPKVKTQAGVVQ